MEWWILGGFCFTWAIIVGVGWAICHVGKRADEWRNPSPTASGRTGGGNARREDD